MSVEPQSPADASDRELRAVVEDLASEVQELREENQQLRERVDELETTVSDAKDHSARERAQLASRITTLEDNTPSQDDLQALEDDIENEKRTRSQQDAQTRRRVNAVAEKAGVELTDADLAEDDKIAQLLSVGPEAVTDRVYDVHHRARALLQHPEDWGRTGSDQQGIRVVYHAPEVRPFLESYYDQSFSTAQVKRVFEKIEDLAADSIRRVSAEKTMDGTHALRVGVLHEHDPLYWKDEQQ